MIRELVLLLSAAVAAPVIAQQTAAPPVAGQGVPAVADFLGSIGGNTDIRTVDGQFTPSPYTGTDRLTVPLERDRGRVLGYRFFREKRRDNATATAEAARDAFAAECREKGGTIEPTTSEVAMVFHRQIADGIEYHEPGAKHLWVAINAVCSRGPANVMGGFLAAVYDPTAAAGAISAIVGRVPIKTAIYAYGPHRIASAAALQARQTRASSEIKADQDWHEAFQRDLAIGTDTNCGTVIQIRGPMIEIAMPPDRLTPNGKSTFWSRRDVLRPPRTAPCTFGL